MEAELINAALAALAGCVCEELRENGDLCFCGITLGDQYISMAGIGDCEDACGEAWVRVETVLTGDIPGETQQYPGDCSTGLSLAVEVGVLRCMKIEEDGEAPSARDLLCAANEQINDMVALKRALLCCEHFDQVIVGSWLPRGPEAGLVGGSWTATVAL